MQDGYSLSDMNYGNMIKFTFPVLFDFHSKHYILHHVKSVCNSFNNAVKSFNPINYLINKCICL